MRQFGPFRNSILKTLDPDVLARLKHQPHHLKVNSIMERQGDEIKHLYFLEDGIGSMTTPFQDGSEAEVGLFGYESVIGVSALIGTKRSLNRTYMQSDGHGYTCAIEHAQAEFKRGESFHDLVLRYTQAQLMQTAQTAGCNAKHSVSQRLARWLLLCRDRLGSGTLPLTHEFLGHMLCIRRTSVHAAADKFRKQGLIDYTRGKIVVLNQVELEAHACECYRVVRNHLSNYTEVEQGAI
ncbi:MAG: Crp/Fnr family transcriptional regulator [Acidobacteria bacterium]|nr:Crp/Fnr family transcriptional regulator [Acidobacteriota bacterium]